MRHLSRIHPDYCGGGEGTTGVLTGTRARPGRLLRVTAATLLTGGRIHSPAAPDATAMAIAGGMVAWVGQDGPGRALYPDAEQVDLDGALVAPAFVDAHVHATATGLHLAGIDLAQATDAATLLELVARAAREAAAGEIVVAHGWDETTWTSPRVPSRAELDRAAGDVGVYLSRVDVHSALVSTAMVERAPSARESAGWSPEGPLTAAAHHAVRAAVRASITPAQRERAQTAFLDAAAASGIAFVHECAGPDISGADDLAALLALGTRPDRPAVVGYWGELARPGATAALETAVALGARGLAGDLFVDGALGSRTAALRAPYTDAPSTSGNRYLDAEAIADHVALCTAEGLQAGFHVIGDAAVAEVVSGFALAEQRVGQRAMAAAGHRLEHLEMVTAEQAAQLARWNVAASVQLQFDALWGGPDGMYSARLGAERARALNPFAMLASAGVVLAGGSDSPVTSLNPWEGVRAAAAHHTEGAALSARAAFNAYTRGGHRAAGVNDGLSGTLVPGAPAHYAVWDAGEVVVAATDSRVQRWSTDPRSRVPGLPSLEQGEKLPACLRTVRAGVTLYEAS